MKMMTEKLWEKYSDELTLEELLEQFASRKYALMLDQNDRPFMPVVVDKDFLTLAVSSLLQVQGEIPDTSTLVVIDWEIDDEEEILNLTCELVEETIQ